MNIILYTGFAKKKNSTKVPPSGTTSITLTGTLKEPCSVMQPVFQIKRGAIDAVPDPYTYAYIAVFGRYYFVRDVTWRDGLWEISLEVDVLASYRTQIGNSTHYVLRTNSNTTNFDPLITDTIYPATNNFDIYHTTMVNSDFASTIAGGCYIVGIISKGDTSSVGAICYYAMDSTEFGDLNDILFSDQNLYTMGITDAVGNMLVNDMSKEILKTMYNPYQYIASCIWFPFSKSKFTYSTQVGINIGWWTYSSLSGSRINAQVISFLASESASFHAHPQATTRGDYLNYAPYTNITMFGRFGTVNIDPSYLKTGYTIEVSYYIDLITGQCRAHIYANDNATNPSTFVICDRIFQLGVPIQISQVGVDYMGAALATVDTAGVVMSAVRYADVGMAVSGIAHGIYDTIQSKMPIVETGGANGSFMSPFTVTHIQFHHYTIVDEDIDHKGRPLCQNKVINTLTGFVLCADGEFDISCLDEERTMINNYLTEGFFWE